MSTVGMTEADESQTNGATAETETGDGEAVPLLETDDLFHILQNQRRRRVLKLLQGTEERVDMRDVAEQVAAWENDKSVQAITSDERQRVYISLYQSHLPKLDEKGIIEYNQSRGFVRRTPVAEQFDPYLSVDGGNSDVEDAAVGPTFVERSTRYYGTATAVAAAVSAAAWAGVGPAILTGYAAVLVVGVFAVTALALYAGD